MQSQHLDKLGYPLFWPGVVTNVLQGMFVPLSKGEAGAQALASAGGKDAPAELEQHGSLERTGGRHSRMVGEKTTDVWG